MHVSVPGHAVMSLMVPAPGSARCARSSAEKTAGRSASLTQRRSMFWSAVVRIVSPVNCRAMSASARPCSDVEVAERERDERHDVARLALGHDVGLPPAREALRHVGGQRSRRANGLLVGGVEIGQERRPARIGPQLCPLFEHAARLVSSMPELLDDELEPRARAILPLPETGEDAAHRLRDRKELLFGEKLVEEQGGLRDRAEPACPRRARSHA